ncbi:unnamed protein product [Schistosoma mattheei]|uniref:2-phosphoxylose phosphatase 1 n=1 Tax=Schistosoma mattheei TaxID=31246 RepID=A0A183NXM0_9TREM|nr:unnamed protein product [Schistosoma mattheei]
MSNDWRPTRVGREWRDEPTNVEVTHRGQHLTWTNSLTYQGAIDALKTVQNRGRCYRNILVKVDTSESIWPEGTDKLTNIGIQQQFILGRWMRMNYLTFVPQKYNSSTYHLRSTDADKTLTSAIANSAGFYWQSSSPFDGSKLHWSPVPVHEVSKISDILFGSYDCPRLRILQKMQTYMTHSTRFENQHKNLFQILRNNTGLSINRLTIEQIANFLQSIKNYNVTLPSWCTKQLLNELFEVADYYWMMLFSRKYAALAFPIHAFMSASDPSCSSMMLSKYEKYVKSSSDIIRLEIGLFLHNIIQHIYSIIQGKSIYISNNITLSNKHLMVYSITNHQFAYLLNAFGILNNNKPIEYASVISLELYGPSVLSNNNNNNNQYILKILYKNGWIDEIGHYVILPICKKFNYFYDCPLNLIIKQLNTFTINPQFYINECSLILDQLINNNNNNNNHNVYEFLLFNSSMRINFIIFISNFILVIILWSFVIYFKKLEKTKKRESNKTKIIEQLIINKQINK